MFQCHIHSWFSVQSPCPACHPFVSVTSAGTENYGDTAFQSTPERKYLFTTEDGVKVFEGDRVWYVNKGLMFNYYDFVQQSADREDDLKYYADRLKFFSTHAAAQSYIDKQKKEVKEEVAKDWEIVHRVNGVGWVHKESSCIDSEHPIHSVRRLSDGEVFSVGDKTTIGTIKKFELNNGIMYWWNKQTWYYLSQAIRAAAPTEIKYEGELHAEPEDENKSVTIEETRRFPEEDFFRYRIYSDTEIPKDKLPAITQAIEAVLNNDPQPPHPPTNK